MKLLRNRLFVGALCIVTALLLSFFVFPTLQGESQSSYADIVRMKEPIKAGTQITIEMLETVNVPEKLAYGRIRNISSIVGQYAKTDFYAGDYLTTEKISTTSSKQTPFSAGSQKDKTIVSVTLPSLAAGVSGRLLPGDVVTVMALPRGSINQSLGLEPETAVESIGDAVIYPELMYLEVSMVTANDGANAKVAALPDEDESNTLPMAVSFYVDQTQALRLAELEHQGIIHLAFVARGESAALYIPDEERVLSTEVD